MWTSSHLSKARSNALQPAIAVRLLSTRPQCRVAGLGCLAERVNANGILPQSPGIMSLSTPTGLCPRAGCDMGGTPMGFDGIVRSLLRVGARSSCQLWALRRNAFGVRSSGRRSAPVDDL
jgi:hypothetical protein